MLYVDADIDIVDDVSELLDMHPGVEMMCPPNCVDRRAVGDALRAFSLPADPPYADPSVIFFRRDFARHYIGAATAGKMDLNDYLPSVNAWNVVARQNAIYEMLPPSYCRIAQRVQPCVEDAKMIHYCADMQTARDKWDVSDMPTSLRLLRGESRWQPAVSWTDSPATWQEHTRHCTVLESADGEEFAAEAGRYNTMWAHEPYRRISPGLNFGQKHGWVNLLRKHRCRTILDAGCGSGKLLNYLAKNMPEARLVGFDCAGNCLDPEPAAHPAITLKVGNLWAPGELGGPFDAVICTDVMEHIPEEHVKAVLVNLRQAASKMVLLSICLKEDNFGPHVIGEHLHHTVHGADWWMQQLEEAGYGDVHPYPAEENWLSVVVHL